MEVYITYFKLFHIFFTMLLLNIFVVLHGLYIVHSNGQKLDLFFKKILKFLDFKKI